MSMLLIVLLLLLFLAGVPTWGFHSYGYWPSSVVGVLLVVCIVLLLAGRL